MDKLCVIKIDGNWCNGYWWNVVSCKTGNTVQSGGPYHQDRHEQAATFARQDAEAWCEENYWKVIRYI